MSIPLRLGLGSVDLGEHHLSLRRAWPREGRKLLLEYVDQHDRVWAGQWYGEDSDQSHLERICRQTAAAAPGRQVRIPHELGLVVQEGGADRKLLSLAHIAGEPGNTLVSHRAEKRAVVKLYGVMGHAKIVEPAKAPALIHAGQAAASLEAVSAPRLLWADYPRGVATWETLPGHTLHQLGNEAPTESWTALGSQLRRLHSTPAPRGLPTHEWRHETKVIETWFRRFAAFAPRQADRLSPTVTRAVADLADDAAGLALIHRDLHDKQVLLDRRGRIHWIDFDTLSVGEPALDLANLLVHLDLRVAQGSLVPDKAVEAAGAVLDSYRPSAAVRRRFAAYAATTLLRLYFLYSFRPRPLPPELAFTGAIAQVLNMSRFQLPTLHRGSNGVGRALVTDDFRF